MLDNMNCNIQEYKKFLSEIPKLEIKSPAITFGTIFRHEHKENFISDWLAYLLDPKNTNTSKPLESLISLALEKEDCNIDFSDVEIQREYVFFDDKRRIDFLIKTPSHIIGIENKIWSGLQNNQLKDYYKHISKLQKKYEEVGESLETILILLCPQSNLVKNQISNNFKLVTYEKLIESFKKIRFNCLENIRAAILMEDFISHVEGYFMDNKGTTLNLDFINFQIEKRDMINKLNNDIRASKEQFKMHFKKEIEKSGFNHNYWEIIPKDGKNYFMQIYKSTWNNGNVHFELLTDDNFPPNEIRVEFHIEGGLTQNEAFKALKKEIVKRSSIKISYENNNFEACVKEVINTLKDFDNKYTKKVDNILEP